MGWPVNKMLPWSYSKDRSSKVVPKTEPGASGTSENRYNNLRCRVNIEGEKFSLIPEINTNYYSN